jgi:hypothetical protein
MFLEVTVSVILSKNMYAYVYYSERFPRYSYFAIVLCTDEQHAVSLHELQSALILKMEFSQMYYIK